MQDLLTVAVLLFTLAYPSTTTTSPTMNSVDGSNNPPACPTGQKC